MSTLRTLTTLARHPYAIPAVGTLAGLDLIYHAFWRRLVRERVGIPPRIVPGVRFPRREAK